MTAAIDMGQTVTSFPSSMQATFKGLFEDLKIKCEIHETSSTLFFQLSCKLTEITEFPPIHIKIAGYVFTLTSKMLIDICGERDVISKKFICLMEIEFQEGGTQIVFGKTFIEYVTLAFNFDREEIWLSQAGVKSAEVFDAELKGDKKLIKKKKKEEKGKNKEVVIIKGKEQTKETKPIPKKMEKNAKALEKEKEAGTFKKPAEIQKKKLTEEDKKVMATDGKDKVQTDKMKKMVKKSDKKDKKAKKESDVKKKGGLILRREKMLKQTKRIKPNLKLKP